MSPNYETQQSDARSWIWLAGAVGTAAGLAALAYGRRERGPWENAKRTMARAAETARRETQPWMGAAAAALAGAGTLAYRLSHKESAWEPARSESRRMAVRTGTKLRPWITVAASTAISLAAAAYNRKEWERAKGAVAKSAEATTGMLAGTGLSLLQRVQRISGETRKLYPRVRKLIA